MIIKMDLSQCRESMRFAMKDWLFFTGWCCTQVSTVDPEIITIRHDYYTKENDASKLIDCIKFFGARVIDIR